MHQLSANHTESSAKSESELSRLQAAGIHARVLTAFHRKQKPKTTKRQPNFRLVHGLIWNLSVHIQLFRFAIRGCYKTEIPEQQFWGQIYLQILRLVCHHTTLLHDARAVLVLELLSQTAVTERKPTRITFSIHKTFSVTRVHVIAVHPNKNGTPLILESTNQYLLFLNWYLVWLFSLSLTKISSFPSRRTQKFWPDRHLLAFCGHTPVLTRKVTHSCGFANGCPLHWRQSWILRLNGRSIAHQSVLQF